MDSNVIRFTVPGDPKGKGRHRATIVQGRIKTYSDKKTVCYENLVRLSAMQAMAGKKLLVGPVAIKIDMVFAVPQSWSRKKKEQALDGSIQPTKKPDMDNVLKSICDGMNNIVFHDDSAVTIAFLVKRFGEKPGVNILAWQEESFIQHLFNKEQIMVTKSEAMVFTAPVRFDDGRVREIQIVANSFEDAQSVADRIGLTVNAQLVGVRPSNMDEEEVNAYAKTCQALAKIMYG